MYDGYYEYVFLMNYTDANNQNIMFPLHFHTSKTKLILCYLFGHNCIRVRHGTKQVYCLLANFYPHDIVVV